MTSSQGQSRRLPGRASRTRSEARPRGLRTGACAAGGALSPRPGRVAVLLAASSSSRQRFQARGVGSRRARDTTAAPRLGLWLRLWFGGRGREPDVCGRARGARLSLDDRDVCGRRRRSVRAPGSSSDPRAPVEQEADQGTADPQAPRSRFLAESNNSATSCSARPCSGAERLGRSFTCLGGAGGLGSGSG